MPITTDSLPNTYGLDTIIRMADAAGLPPTSPLAAVTIADSQLGNQDIIRVLNANKMLHEQWGCDEPGHDLCLRGGHYIGHIQLSQEHISIWIDEICRGQATCHYPPEVLIIPDGSGSNMNPNVDWGAGETNTDPEPDIGPGYFCGLALERVGRTVLYHSKVWLILAKLSFYEQVVNGRGPFRSTRRPYKRPSAQRLGITLQETVDLMRPSYPPYIREQASKVFVRVSYDSDAHRRDDCPQLVLEWLGWVFRYYERSPEIMSALYRNLTSAPLHIHYDEVLSNFIVILARYHTGSWERDHIGRPFVLAHLMRYLCRLRKLSFYELNAIHDYLESWLQPEYDMLSEFFTELTQAMPDPTTQDGPTPESLTDARFHILSEALLYITLDTTIGAISRDIGFDSFLWRQACAVNRFFEDRVLLIEHAKKINRIASFIAFYLRHVAHALLSTDILTYLPLLVIFRFNPTNASPDPEFSCSEIQAENVVNAFVDFFSHFDPLDFRHPRNFEDFSRLKSDSHSLLLLIANPFTGPSVLSSSHCMSILEDNGWVGNALSASN
ncbi:hypothetical protein BU17DRAFT_83791 [Hysterangium stoloniferum]|nr:hypothetical protein BU17DRAFT_83791 [Hysterangium stoloniferum]